MEQIKKHIFWVVTAVLLLAMVVASFVVTNPVRSQNESQIHALEQRIVQLGNYAKKCVNKYHIEHERKRLRNVREEEKRCRKLLIENVHLFVELFRDDPALWKDAYTKALTELRQKLDAKKILYSSPTPFHNRLPVWGDRVPTQAEMRVANKEYYILKDLCDLLCSVQDEQKRARVLKVNQVGFPGVADFNEAAFDPEGGGGQEQQPKRKTIRDTYRPIPTIVNVDMDSKFVEKLLAAVLSSPWRYNLHTCEIIRKPKDSKQEEIDVDMGGPGAEETRKKRLTLPQARLNLFENTTVRVRLYLEALDFSPLKAALRKRAEGEAEE